MAKSVWTNQRELFTNVREFLPNAVKVIEKIEIPDTKI